MPLVHFRTTSAARGARKSKRGALGRIASLTQVRTYSPHAEWERGKDARRWIPPPEGPGGRSWRGGDHAIGDRRSREVSNHALCYPGAQARSEGPQATAWRAGAACTKPGSHNVGLDEERRARFLDRARRTSDLRLYLPCVTRNILASIFDISIRATPPSLSLGIEPVTVHTLFER